MNKDIQEYPIYFISNGKLEPCLWIKSTKDYDHYRYNLHHFIPKGKYKVYKKWYIDHNIEQKLIYMPIWLHIELHNLSYSDEEFENKNHISRWELIFNRKHSKY